MPKQIVLTGIGNRIKYATTNGKGLITGKAEDVTDEAIAAVFEHMMREFKKRKDENEDVEQFTYEFKGHGKMYYKPD